MQKLLIKCLVKSLRSLPIWVGHRLSDSLYYLAYYILKYRRQVVLSNLQRCFPSRSKPELASLAKTFYRSFCDSLVEAIYCSDDPRLKKRITLTNPEVLEQFKAQNKKLFLLAGHYYNWQWLGTLMLQYQMPSTGAYKPLHNATWDAVIREARANEYAKVMEASKVGRDLLRKAKEEGPYLYYLIADQKPFFDKKTASMNFLGQQTEFTLGADFLARKVGWPVYYSKVERISRSHYHLTLEPLIENPTDSTEGEVITTAMQALEQQILTEPAGWMWTHRRWQS